MAKRTRGERAGLTRERVLSVALQLVDDEGLDALTMRKLAAALGVEAMTLYHYLPNKAALLDGLVESVLDEPTRPAERNLRADHLAGEEVLLTRPATRVAPSAQARWPSSEPWCCRLRRRH